MYYRCSYTPIAKIYTPIGFSDTAVGDYVNDQGFDIG